MIRLINMDNQITEGDRAFALWDTVRDRFVEVLDSQAWDSADELAQDLDAQIEISRKHSKERLESAVDRRERLLSLAKSAGY